MTEISIVRVPTKEQLDRYQAASDWIKARQAEAEEQGAALFEPTEDPETGIVLYFARYGQSNKIRLMYGTEPLDSMPGTDRAAVVKFLKSHLEKV